MQIPQKTMVEYTEDKLLNGRVIIKQPAQGYRVAMDSVFLAAAVDAKPGETILDIGTGVGAAALCLATRVPQCRIIGLEVQKINIRMAADNIALNNMRSRVEVLWGDLIQPPPRLAAGTFSHVMANPPYLDSHRSNVNATSHKQISHVEETAGLEQWVRFALLMAKPKGTVTFIHRADRLHDLLMYFHGKLGDIVIYPLWPGLGKPAKRVLIRGRKSTHGPTTLSQGMILHGSDGKYLPEAEAVLRNVGQLSI